MDLSALRSLVAEHVSDDAARFAITAAAVDYGTHRVTDHIAAMERSDRRVTLGAVLVLIERAIEEPHIGWLRDSAIARAISAAERAGLYAVVAALSEPEDDAPLVDGIRTHSSGPDLDLAHRLLEAARAAIPY